MSTCSYGRHVIEGGVVVAASSREYARTMNAAAAGSGGGSGDPSALDGAIDAAAVPSVVTSAQATSDAPDSRSKSDSAIVSPSTGAPELHALIALALASYLTRKARMPCNAHSASASGDVAATDGVSALEAAMLSSQEVHIKYSTWMGRGGHRSAGRGGSGGRGRGRGRGAGRGGIGGQA